VSVIVIRVSLRAEHVELLSEIRAANAGMCVCVCVCMYRRRMQLCVVSEYNGVCYCDTC
jgi:hypothetical protein